VYFPFLYGRRSEFLALRAMVKDHRSLDALVPVIEPVKRDISDLTRCIEHFGKADQALAVILNPDKFELKSNDEAKAWRKEILGVIAEYHSVLPTYRCVSTTTLAQVNSFLKLFEDREVALAYSSPSLADADITTLAAKSKVRFHIVLNGKMTASQQKFLPATKRVDIRDYFNKLERNSDYDGDELFTDRHKTFKPGKQLSLFVLWQQGRARNPLFFGCVLHRFFEDLVLQGFLAQDALQLGDLGSGCGQFGGRHHGFAGRHRHQSALTI